MPSTDLKSLEYAIAEFLRSLPVSDWTFTLCDMKSSHPYVWCIRHAHSFFSHWSFGKTFNKMKMEYESGLSKIYELVINSDPCYAFLLDSNSLVQNKLIVASRL